MIPQPRTERLVLRGFRQDDFEIYTRSQAIPKSCATQAELPFPALMRGAASRSSSAIGHYAATNVGSGTEIGPCIPRRVGLWNPEGWPGLEVGWSLGKEYWGQGYATEAAHAAMGYAFLTQDIPLLISVIDIDNLASQRVAERLGETRGEQRVIEYQGKSFTTDIWSISREEWERRA